MDSKNKFFVVIGSITLVATTTIGGYTLYAKRDSIAPVHSTKDPAATRTAAAVPIIPPTTKTGAVTSDFKDGSYTASSSYVVPHGGHNTISVTVGVSGGTITSVKTTDDYSDSESSMYIGSFEDSLNRDANGRSLADYYPSRIGGASLTTAAFGAVLDQIRTTAAT